MKARDFIEGSRVLVVDDEADLRELVEDILYAEGAEPVTAPNGACALQVLGEQNFDLILLDVMMPEMDGFRVAAKYREMEAANGGKIATPILMLTALSGQTNIITALDGGADDYLVKPFHHGELLARAGGLLRVRRTQEKIAGLLAARERMAGALVHDLRTPLSAILLNAAVLLPKAVEKDVPLLEDIRDAGTEMSRLLDDVLLAARSEHLGLVPNLTAVDLGELVTGAVQRIRRATVGGSTLEITVDLSVEARARPVELDEKLFRRVLDNLLGNAVKYGERSAMVVRAHVDESIHLEVADAGPGIPAEVREEIFQPFARAAHAKEGFGVGLAFCRTAVEAHGGRIWADASDLGGAAMKIAVPVGRARR